MRKVFGIMIALLVSVAMFAETGVQAGNSNPPKKIASVQTASTNKILKKKVLKRKIEKAGKKEKSESSEGAK